MDTEAISKAEGIVKKIIWTLYQLSVSSKSPTSVITSYLSQLITQLKSLDSVKINTEISSDMLSAIDAAESPYPIIENQMSQITLALQKSTGRTTALEQLKNEIKRLMELENITISTE